MSIFSHCFIKFMFPPMMIPGLLLGWVSHPSYPAAHTIHDHISDHTGHQQRFWWTRGMGHRLCWWDDGFCTRHFAEEKTRCNRKGGPWRSQQLGFFCFLLFFSFPIYCLGYDLGVWNTRRCVNLSHRPEKMPFESHHSCWTKSFCIQRFQKIDLGCEKIRFGCEN